MRRCFLIISLVLSALFLLSCTKEDDAALKSIIFTNVKDGKLALSVGKEFRLLYVLEPVEASKTVQLEWVSSNPTVATVRAGQISTLSPGKTTITVSAANVSATVDVTVKIIDVEEFDLPSKLSAYVGREVLVDVEIAKPAGAGIDGIEWSIKDESIATCEIKGGKLYLTAHKNGTTTLTGTAKGSGLKKTCTIETSTYVPVNSVIVSLGKSKLAIGTSTSVTAKISPSDASIKDITWKVEPGLVTLDEKAGTVTAGQQTGSVTITATVDGVTGSAVLEVTPPRLESFTLKAPEGNPYCHICPDSSISGYPKTIKLVQTITPSNLTPEITWTSSDTKVATVAADGTITAVGHGVAVIKAVVDDIQTTCIVRSMQDSKVKWHRAYLAPPSNQTTELSALYQPRQGVSFFYWDPASKYESEGKYYYDSYFFYYKNGKFVKPTISAPSSLSIYSSDGYIDMVSSGPVEGNVRIDFGIGDPLDMKIDTHIRSASLSWGEDNVYRTINKRATITISKKDFLKGEIGKNLIIYSNGAAGYSKQFSTYMIEYSCDTLSSSYFEVFGGVSTIWIKESSPKGTFTFQCVEFDTSFSFSIKITD